VGWFVVAILGSGGLPHADGQHDGQQADGHLAANRQARSI
jgi:hypothetical protein